MDELWSFVGAKANRQWVWIAMDATTALFTGSTLLTRNVRDFKNIPPLSVRKI